MSISQVELKDFEQQADAWFAEHKPSKPDFILPETFMEVGTDQQFEYLRDWQNKVYEAGRRRRSGVSGYRHQSYG